MCIKTKKSKGRVSHDPIFVENKKSGTAQVPCHLKCFKWHNTNKKRVALQVLGMPGTVPWAVLLGAGSEGHFPGGTQGCGWTAPRGLYDDREARLAEKGQRTTGPVRVVTRLTRHSEVTGRERERERLCWSGLLRVGG